MNSNWAPLFVASSLLFLTTQIAAQEHAVLGQGNVSCGSWLNDRKGDDGSGIEQDRVVFWLRAHSINTDPSQKATYLKEKAQTKSWPGSIIIVANIPATIS